LRRHEIVWAIDPVVGDKLLYAGDGNLLDILGDIFDARHGIVEDLGDGFALHLGRLLPLEGPGAIEVRLANGRTLHKALFTTPIPTLEWLAEPRAASCTTAPAIYNAVQCDSVKSDVGTPPYPCCDNNGDRKATGATDGNCTWYAWYKAKKIMGWTVPSTWGGGGSWCTNASKTKGWKVSSVPAVNTIACSTSMGHVGWVAAVSTDKKSVTLEEMNCRVSPTCFASGLRTKTYTNSSSFLYISKQ